MSNKQTALLNHPDGQEVLFCPVSRRLIMTDFMLTGEGDDEVSHTQEVSVSVPVAPWSLRLMAYRMLALAVELEGEAKPQFTNNEVAHHMADLLQFIEGDEFAGTEEDFDVIRDCALSAIGAVSTGPVRIVAGGAQP